MNETKKVKEESSDSDSSSSSSNKLVGKKWERESSSSDSDSDSDSDSSSSSSSSSSTNKRVKISETAELKPKKEVVWKVIRIDNRMPNGTFSWVDPTLADSLPISLQDNSYHAKAWYGNGGDDFGMASNDWLDPTKGKSFRKEKTKMKNKTFHGMGNRIGS